jgi:hypothetical protein
MEEFAKKVNLTLGSVFEGYILEDLKADIRFIGECQLGIWAQLRPGWIFFHLTNIIACCARLCKIKSWSAVESEERLIWPTVVAR